MGGGETGRPVHCGGLGLHFCRARETTNFSCLRLVWRVDCCRAGSHKLDGWQLRWRLCARRERPPRDTTKKSDAPRRLMGAYPKAKITD